MSKPMACTACGTVGKPKTVTRGSFFIEVILWLCFLIPGLLYTVWRLTTRAKACPACGSTTLVPPDSPAGKRITQQYRATA